MDEATDRTSASLLGRLGRGSATPEDWAAFAGRYGPLILLWCRHWKVQDADARDLAQDVLARLASRMATFRYDPSRSFRAYVKTLARYAWCDLLEARKRPGASGSGDSAVLEALDQVAARDDLGDRLADAFDRELLEEAGRLVRLRVEPRTWEAFRLMAVEGKPGIEAAAEVGMDVAAAYKAKSKVRKMLKDEVARLQQDH